MMIVQWLSVWPLQSMLPSSCAANWAMLKVERLLDQWCNLWKICVQLVLHFSYLLATQSVIGRTSQPTNSASQQTPKLDVVCVPSRHRHWLSAVCGCQPSVTKLSSRRPSYLEQSTAARHVSTVTGHLLQSPQDWSLQALLSMTSPFSRCAREVTCHYGHVNRFCYLLTYLLTYTLCRITIKNRLLTMIRYSTIWYV